ncbi:hypothetical protein SALBM311S_10310 [Streptomyces alboniger]
MVPAEAASRDVWAFMALVLLPDVAFWRYPQPPRDRVLGTDLTRHVFGRLWWRAQLRCAASDVHEPYGALKILGEAAFDQIYARRAALGGSPHMVRAILRVWQDLDLTGLNERETLRDFLKRLLRLAPFVLFDGIDEQALDEELHAVAQESVDAQRAASSPPVTDTAQSGQDTPLIVPRELPQSAAVGGMASVTRTAPMETAESRRFRSVEICAGAGAQALGLGASRIRPRPAHRQQSRCLLHD